MTGGPSVVDLSDRAAASDLSRCLAVFLDRDGVLNRTKVRAGKPYAPRRLQDFRLMPGAAASVEALKRAGFLVVVATNQPDIGNGHVDRAVVDAMHDRLMASVPVDAIRLCPHAQTAGCNCRKPRPGMLLSAAAEFRIDLARSFMVGDRAGDVAAGVAAGCRSVFIERNYAEAAPKGASATVASLAAAVRWILAHAADPLGPRNA